MTPTIPLASAVERVTAARAAASSLETDIAALIERRRKLLLADDDDGAAQVDRDIVEARAAVVRHADKAAFILAHVTSDEARGASLDGIRGLIGLLAGNRNSLLRSHNRNADDDKEILLLEVRIAALNNLLNRVSGKVHRPDVPIPAEAA